MTAACVWQGTEQGSKWGRASGDTTSPIHWAAGGGLQRAPVLRGREPAWGLGLRTQSSGGVPPAVQGVGLWERTHRTARTAARMTGTLSALWLHREELPDHVPPKALQRTRTGGDQEVDTTSPKVS